MRDQATGRCKGYGFVSFRTQESAQYAIDTMNGQVLGARRVRCGWAQHKCDSCETPVRREDVEKASPGNTNVYVGNLSPELTEQELRQHFEGRWRAPAPGGRHVIA